MRFYIIVFKNIHGLQSEQSVGFMTELSRINLWYVG